MTTTETYVNTAIDREKSDRKITTYCTTIDMIVI